MDEKSLQRTLTRMRDHHSQYPGFGMSDAYKLLYQGCMGPEHAVADAGRTRAWLEKEWASVNADGNEELYQDITIHHPVYRMNLRAAKAQGIPRETIHEGFMDLARTFPKRPELLRELWDEVGQRIIEGEKLVLNPRDIEDFNTMLEENDYPAVHHSPEYRERNRPAYRLIGMRAPQP